MLRHRRRRAALAALALTLALALPGAAQDAPARRSLADMVPAETLAYLEIPAFDQAHAAFAGTDIGRAWTELRPFVDEMTRGLDAQITDGKAEFEHDTGLAIDDLVRALGGGVEVAFVRAPGRHGTPPEVIALAHTAGREDVVARLLERVREKAAERGRHIAARQQGALKFHTLQDLGPDGQPRGPSLTLVEAPGALAATSTPEMADTAAKALAGGAIEGAMLGQSADFAAAMKRAGHGGAKALLGRAYINAAPLVDQAIGRDEKAAKAAQQTGLKELRSIALELGAQGEKVGFAVHIRAPQQGPARKGVLGVLAHGNADAAALAKLAPRDAASFAAMRMDLGATWDRALALVEEIDARAAADMKREIAEAERRLRMSIRGDLLDCFGSDWAAISFTPPGGGLPVAIMTVSLKDAEKFARTFRDFTDTLGFETRELQRSGKTIRYLRAPLGRFGQDPFRGRQPDPMAMFAGSLPSAYVVEGGRLWLADMPQTIEDFLAGTKAGGTLAENPAFQASLQASGPAAMFVYQDPRALMPAVWNTVIRLAKIAEGFARKAGIPVDTALLPTGGRLGQILTPGAMDLSIDPEGVTLRARAMSGAEVGFAAGAIIAAVAIPNLVESRKGANEAAAIGALRTLTTAQALYREGDKDRDAVLDYAASLQELGRANLIDGVLASGTKMGYRFEIRIPDGGDQQFQWTATARPVQPGKSGDRSFFVDESGVIRWASPWEEVGPESTPLGG